MRICPDEHRRFTAVLALALAILVPSVGAAEPARPDLEAWRRLPVFDGGRIMPLDSLANSVVEQVVGRANPTLVLAGRVPEKELARPEFAEAKQLFPNGKARKFHAAEMLLSWLVEPEKWEEVPFLHATQEELRTKYLDVPLKGSDGVQLQFVSPRQVAEAEAFQQRLDELRQLHQEAQAEGKEFQLTGTDRRVNELWQAYLVFRTITFDPTLDPAARAAFQRQLRTVATAWSRLDGSLEMFTQLNDQQGLAAAITRLNESLAGIDQLSQQGSFPLAEGEKAAGEFAGAARAVAEWFATNQERLLTQPPPDWDAEQLAKVRTLFAGLADDTRALADSADRLLGSLYENSDRLRVVPALNAAALEDGRDPEDESQPWLDLQTLLFASDRGLAAYPAEPIQEVRREFRRLAQAYRNRTAEVGPAAEALAASLAKLGTAIEPLRERLPIQHRDEALVAYTAYPAPDFTAAEVRYNTLNPFLWSWVIMLVATLAFAGVFVFGQGNTATSRKLFWFGFFVLLAGLGWSAYGFYLRVVITRWAPVTNMYETVIYVPFFVGILGAWLTLMPLAWEGLKNGWRWSGIPGTWEATPLSAEQCRVMSPAAWQRGAWVLLLPRLALSVALFSVLTLMSYAAGGRRIINLLPDVDQGSTLPTGNDLLTWGVGLVVLVSAVLLLPRAVLALAAAPVMVPRTLRASGRRDVLAGVYPRWPFVFAATGVAFFGCCLASFAPVLNKEFSPLTPVLRDNFWLLIHVLTIVSSYGAGALAWGLGNIALAYYLLGRYRQPALALAGGGHRPAMSEAPDSPALGRIPPAASSALAGFVYKAVQVAVLLLAAGTILGALWADVAWGRFWGWDPKEVWALISLLVYVAILHGRFAGWVNNFGLVAGTVLGFTAIVMSWYGVNFVLGAGLHSYGFGEDQTANWYVAGFIGLNWILLGLAAGRYFWETRSPAPGLPAAAKPPAEEPAEVGAGVED